MLVPCDRCRRHVRGAATTCPFCDAPRAPTREGEDRVPRLSRAASALLRTLLAQAPLAVACAAATPPREPPKASSTQASTSASAVQSASSSASASASASASEWVSTPASAVPIYGSNTLLVLQRVFFDLGSTTISKQNDWLFDALVDILKRYPLALITIQPRAETVEGKDEAARLALSEKRGEAIRARILAAGGDPARVKVEPLSDKKPLTAGKTKEERAQNRSTSFSLTRIDGAPLDESDAGKTK